MRPTASSRPILAFALSCAAAGGLAACHRQPFDPEKIDDLNALLADGDLEQLPPSAVTAAAPRPSDPVGTVGTVGSSGAGGRGGSTGGGMGMGGAGGCIPFPGPVPPPPFPGGGPGRPPGRAGASPGANPAAPVTTPPATPPSMPPPPAPAPPPVPVPTPPPPPIGDAGAPPDGGGGLPFCRPGPLANWNFDDCNAFRTELSDSVGGFAAFRTVNAACAPGIERQGVTLPRAKDLVYSPDQPQFTFGAGVTVAAWVKPGSLKGSQTIFRKRDGLLSSVALMLVNKHFVFVISRQNDKPAAVFVRAPKEEWTHVAATYDGSWLRLYLDGEEAASEYAQGTIEDGEGPLLMGNDVFQRRFSGTLDKVWFDTQPASPETIRTLLCLRHNPTLSATPEKTEPLAPGTPASFDLALTNNNTAQCGAASFEVERDFFMRGDQLEGWSIEPSFSFVQAASGETVHIPLTVVSPDDAEAGDFPIPLIVFPSDFFFDFEQAGRAAPVYVVSAEGCRVSSRKSLFIRDVSVVDDPVRTDFTADPADARRGVWTFKHLMEEMAPRPEDAPALVEALFKSFTTTQTVNGFTIDPRPGFQPMILDPWPRTADGQLDLARAPVRLLAIVNRFDVRRPEEGHAGEGRFVFNLLGNFGRIPPPGPIPGPDPAPGEPPPPPPRSELFPLQATIIVEYMLPAPTEADVKDWAQSWQALGALPFPSEEYNAALEKLTERFARRGAAPGRPNGSAMVHLRTNEIDLGGGAEWQLREFRFGEDGFLHQATIDRTPDRRHNGTQLLADFVAANESTIVAERHQVPLTFQDQPFATGAVFNNLNGWKLPGTFNPEARQKFSLNTCNGCHSAEETNTFFLMVNPRFPGQQSSLSPFLTGTRVFDRATGGFRDLRELSRRNRDLRIEVCPPESIPPLPPPPDAGGQPLPPPVMPPPGPPPKP